MGLKEEARWNSEGPLLRPGLLAGPRRRLVYDQVWSGTLRAASLRMLASLAAKEKLLMRRWDFVAAYLQGELLDNKVVYCFMPSG
jgi:hypothetical protein